MSGDRRPPSLLRQRKDCDPGRSAVGLLCHRVLHAARNGDIRHPGDFVNHNTAPYRVAEIFLQEHFAIFRVKSDEVPLVSPVRTRPPAVGVTEATIEVSAL